MKKLMSILSIIGLFIVTVSPALADEQTNQETGFENVEVDNLEVANEELLEEVLEEEISKEEIIEEESEIDETEAIVEEIEEIEVETLETPEVMNEELIVDDVFREIINAILYQPEGYSPTLEDLQSITFLNLTPVNSSSNYAYINDVSGLELMTNIEEVRIFQSFVPNEMFSVLAGLPKLKEFTFFNSFTSGDTNTIGIYNSSVNGEYVTEVPYEPDMHLGLLGTSQSLEIITATSSYLEMMASYQHRARGKVITEGLGNLKTLRELNIDTFAAIDDPSVSFLADLENLESISIIEVPITNLDVLLQLDPSVVMKINGTEVLDYSELTDIEFYSNNISSSAIVLDPQAYTFDEASNKFTATVNTGVKIPEGAVDLELLVGNNVDYISNEVIDGYLYVTIEADGFSGYTLYDYISNSSVDVGKGFLLAVEYTNAAGYNFEFNPMLAIVSDFVTFDLNSEDTSIAETMIINKPIENGSVNVPTAEDFGLIGYTIEGWYYDKALTQPVDFELELIDSVVFYAKLQEIEKYTVTFESNGGTEVAEITDLALGSMITKPENPTKTGYSFIGWYSDEQLTEVWDFDLDVVTTNMTLYAKWELGLVELEPSIPTPEVPVLPPETPVEPTTPDTPVTPTTPNTPETGIKGFGLMEVSIGLAAVFVLIALSKKKENI